MRFSWMANKLPSPAASSAADARLAPIIPPTLVAFATDTSGATDIR